MEYHPVGQARSSSSYILLMLLFFFGIEVQEVAFEIGLHEQYGLDINDPKETHVLRSLPGRTFSALELLCIMYARLEAQMPHSCPTPQELGMRSQEV